jgi:hypothetical protein
MTCPRCNADGDHIAEHSNVAECGACGYQWSPRAGYCGTSEAERDAFSTDTGERCEPAVARWVPGRAKPWE